VEGKAGSGVGGMEGGGGRCVLGAEADEWVGEVMGYRICKLTGVPV
jgi:hypothetical protein